MLTSLSSKRRISHDILRCPKRAVIANVRFRVPLVALRSAAKCDKVITHLPIELQLCICPDDAVPSDIEMT